MKQRVVATVGLCGTGKSASSAALLQMLDAERVYFGGLVSAEIAARGLVQTPHTEREVNESLRKEGGMDVVARMALPHIRSALARGKNVVIDGLYSFAEYEFLKTELASSITVIALHSSREVRYIRMQARPERSLQPDEVDQRDLHETGKLDKARPITLADFHIVNDGTLDELHASLKRVLK